MKKNLNKSRAEQLDDVGSLAQQIAVNFYSPQDKMWIILLKFKETLEKEHDKLMEIYYNEKKN